MKILNEEWINLFEGKEKEEEIAKIIHQKVLDFVIKVMKQARVSGANPKNVLKYMGNSLDD